MSFLLVAVIVLAAGGVYALARRGYRVPQAGAYVLAASSAGASLLAASIALVATDAQPRDAVMPDVGLATPALVAATADPALMAMAAPPPAPAIIALADAQRLASQGGRHRSRGRRAPDAGAFDPGKLSVTARAGAAITLSGWAANLAEKTTYAGVVAVVDDAPAATGTYGEDRLDVAKYYKAAAVRYSGYHVRLPARELRAMFGKGLAGEAELIAFTSAEPALYSGRIEVTVQRISR